MSNNWRAPSDGSVAHKLLSIELEHHHETQSLRREIKRLRAEVGLMARLRNFHKAETDRLADILRKLPPPIIPTRQTTKVATPSDPQNGTPVQDRGRTRTRDGNGSDKSTSREDGKTRTNEKGKGRDQDTPMTEVPDHTIGVTQNDTSSAPPKVLGATTSPKTNVPAYIHRKPEGQTGHSRSGSRTRAVSVVSELRKARSNTKSPAPPHLKKATAAKKERRKGKEQTRTAAQIEIDRKKVEDGRRKKKQLENRLEEELDKSDQDQDTRLIANIVRLINEVDLEIKS